SVTPADDGAMAVLRDVLGALGFRVWELPFGDPPTPNLFARLGEDAPHLGFAGHTDVVPPGDPAAWRVDPFAGELVDGVVYGRGACDMKGGITAFVAAVAARIDRDGGWRGGSVSLLVTGDEEGPATDGTVRVLDWMAANGQLPEFCVVGEPSNPSRIGEMIKVGRRGTLNARLLVRGVQGHVAYPERADNPVHRLLAALHALVQRPLDDLVQRPSDDLVQRPLDDGSPAFQPSGLQVTSIDVGNPASNVIPAVAEARFNIRFNDRHDGTSLSAHLRGVCEQHAPGCELEIAVGGEPFLCPGSPGLDALRDAVRTVTGLEPALDTGGGTSDARFIAQHCPVAEFGLVGASMHKVDENVPVSELRTLAAVYGVLLDRMLPPGAEAR
ncbi:MAG: succinyl-diaminopimelate desuccinylase, partial [Gluconacetobacter diazotrophicus]|nr:succinyl-diaminopimelate desuccinylase [Gluconacetobacter diazotrophicus]